MVRRLLSRWRSRCAVPRGAATGSEPDPDPPVSSTPPVPPQSHSGAAGARNRALAHGLREARGNRQSALAEQFARAAVRVARHSPHVACELARWYLAQDRSDDALRCLEGCAAQTEHVQLQHAIALCHAGRALEAQMELQGIAGRRSALPEAKHLAALLSAEDDPARANHYLEAQRVRDDDPEALVLLLLTMLQRPVVDESAVAALVARLDRAAEWLPGCLPHEFLIESFGFSRRGKPAAPSQHAVSTLAMELLAHETLLPALISAQREAFDASAARLLAAATERMLPEMHSPRLGYAALTELAHLGDQVEVAERWLARGLRLYPDDPALLEFTQQGRAVVSSPVSDVLAEIAPEATPDRRAA